MLARRVATLLCVSFYLILSGCSASGTSTRTSAEYRRINTYLDSIPAIDTHDHLRPFEFLCTGSTSDGSQGLNLFAIWNDSYYTWCHPLTERKPGTPFSQWWSQARNDFASARATSFYRFLLPAFQDLYGVNFDQITDAQAADVDRRIIEHYRDQCWLYQVITERANIELMIIDPNWAPLEAETEYRFAVTALNTDLLFRGFHPSEYNGHVDDPYRFAERNKLPLNTLDDYVAVVDRIIADAKERGVVCLKNVLAYQRTLEFQIVPKQRAAQAFGKPRKDLSPQEIRDFEDFLMWRIVESAARHDLPIQIHTGHGRLQGSSPMLLVDLIQANPNTKFVLFHGGFPWIGETGVIVMRHGSHVWVDSVWLPTLSYSMAKRAFHEWLEVMPSDHILWGGDCVHPEGTYGATEMTRRCLAEVLAEKVQAGDLTEEHALAIGRQILRDNALALFPTLKSRLWKQHGKLTPP